MKNVLIFLCVGMLALLTGCYQSDKDLKDLTMNYPSVKTLSAVKQPDGTVVVTGEVLYSGKGTIDAAGISMDTVPNPDRNSNRMYADNLSNGVFSCTYSSLKPYKKYYFRAWATLETANVMGSDVWVDSVTYDPIQIPCQPSLNRMILNSTLLNFDEAYSSFATTLTDNTITSRTDQHNITIIFGRKPSSGKYAILTDAQPGTNNVKVLVDASTTNGPSELYVSDIDNRTIEVTICSLDVYAQVGLSRRWFTMSTRFRVGL